MNQYDYVFDTSAVLAIVLAESDRGVAVDVLRRARDDGAGLAIPFIAIMESEYQVIRKLSDADASRFLSVVGEWPAKVFHSSADWSHQAAEIKARGGLSLADAWVASLALRLEAELVHKGDKFDAVPGLRGLRL